MNRLVLLLLLTYSAILGGWRGQETSPDVALREAEARWQSRGPKSYEFTIEVQCFCGGLTRTPIRFAVVNGEPRSLQELQPAAQKIFDHYNTVEKLFTAIRRALSFGGFKVAVQYHADLGYPVVADLDPGRYVADDELVLKVTDFKVTPSALK